MNLWWNVAIIIVGIGVLVGRNGKVGLSSESSLKLFDLKKVKSETLWRNLLRKWEKLLCFGQNSTK